MLSLDEIREDLGKYVLDSDDNMVYCLPKAAECFAIKHFGHLPYKNYLIKKSNKDKPYDICGGELKKYDYDEIDYDEIDFKKTINNIINAYPDSVIFKLGNRAEPDDGYYIFHDKFIYVDEYFLMDTPYLPDDIINCIVLKNKEKKIKWVLRDKRGEIQTINMDIYPKGDLEGNYNDDLLEVDKKINKLLHEDSSSIIILNGKPGTGKTSYIRDLIANNSDLNFYWLDASMFNCLDSTEFVEFIIKCKNSIIILEDCEILLKTREHGANLAMQSLLNISDGMLGDSLKLKFICTFNTDLTNIDKAILRKGRLKIKYEFKDLCKEKVEKLFEKLGFDKNLAKEMPLCDIYNFNDDNGNKVKNKIGF